MHSINIELLDFMMRKRLQYLTGRFQEPFNSHILDPLTNSLNTYTPCCNSLPKIDRRRRRQHRRWGPPKNLKKKKIKQKSLPKMKLPIHQFNFYLFFFLINIFCRIKLSMQKTGPIWSIGHGIDDNEKIQKKMYFNKKKNAFSAFSKDSNFRSKCRIRLTIALKKNK